VSRVRTTTKPVQWGALDQEDHWWLPPSHVRADLRELLPASSWHKTVLLFSFLHFSFVLSELVVTVLERTYPAATAEEKLFFGVILLTSEAVGAIFSLCLAFELWFWTLAFGWAWWGSPANVIEAVVLIVDVGLRLWFGGPLEVGRCLHLIVCFRLSGWWC
jgi:hypothetical protein